MRSDFYNHGIDDLMKLQTHRILDELKGKCDNLVIDIADIADIVVIVLLEMQYNFLRWSRPSVFLQCAGLLSFEICCP